ncbi:putative leucine-rich repeat receptor-like serine/threonine-protein kinase At2g19230 [Prosopis cineraria]|uniref:putative leucine-rich repeat receptor-like serine/threonine-protein kinase At2g19230 n=1 Tax=Prosopis cineraria TaxID=364024 RepID=UPI0024102437|nr:putative leucine-rich repeat receptor-like serine/threonine-protein kinase At2g19230 [Prosopis cineraria]
MASSVENITVVSSDGDEFKITVGTAMQSELLNRMLKDDDCVFNKVPMSPVNTATLVKVMEYCQKHADGGASDSGDVEDLKRWDDEFIKVDSEDMLFHILVAANYLEIVSLFDLACHAVGNLMKGKAPKEIPRIFNIENDFSPEEQERCFMSIDCGASRNYVDEETGIWYQTDEDFIGSGENYGVSPDLNFNNFPHVNRQLLTLRSFPEGKRNCYTLKPKLIWEKNQKYLIRAIFAYGNYDFKNMVPVFDLYIGVNYWTTIHLPNSTFFSFFETIQQVPSDQTVQVCLVNTGQGTPFINTLELRLLSNSLYSTISLPLSLWSRVNCGSKLSSLFVRYKDDVFDRLWKTNDGNNWDVLKASVEGKVEIITPYELPSEVLWAASQPLNDSKVINASWSFSDISKHYYMFLHFTEIQKLPFGHKRIINVTFDDEHALSRELTLEYLKLVTLISNKMTKDHVGFNVTTVANSDAPPILNAYEIYEVGPQPNAPTATQDAGFAVNAIMEIKHTYGISRISWQGDPCAPSKLAWDGLICSSGNNIRIFSLDLSNNDLIGQLPEFLSTLPNLKFLNLAGNKLTGSIPKALKENTKLQLRVGNNPGLCQYDSCQKHKFEIQHIASVAASVILIVVVSLVIWRFRRKRGGFGKVYLGTLEDDTQVAVKLLSPTSRQGYREFQPEAQLLTVIHHRNLVSLVGFCDENDVKALIYEYMDLGDLRGLLSEKNSKVLKWNERLQVAIDAARD